MDGVKVLGVARKLDMAIRSSEVFIDQVQGVEHTHAPFWLNGRKERKTPWGCKHTPRAERTKNRLVRSAWALSPTVSLVPDALDNFHPVSLGMPAAERFLGVQAVMPRPCLLGSAHAEIQDTAFRHTRAGYRASRRRAKGLLGAGARLWCQKFIHRHSVLRVFVGPFDAWLTTCWVTQRQSVYRAS